ncbi:hypothetical protein [Pseudomonas aeruginosa]|uniref:hypothetical protein n=1 Tax=Pseudomonas aeruginosa TaxID=287 RepID=UPI0003B947CA|nr:hypothetical protein [Pseudomonas aeruginosa]ERY09437.1 hypothetical protein Q075_05908 [Pseudomonas aeruginosa BL21]
MGFGVCDFEPTLLDAIVFVFEGVLLLFAFVVVVRPARFGLVRITHVLVVVVVVGVGGMAVAAPAPARARAQAQVPGPGPAPQGQGQDDQSPSAEA